MSKIRSLLFSIVLILISTYGCAKPHRKILKIDYLNGKTVDFSSTMEFLEEGVYKLVIYNHKMGYSQSEPYRPAEWKLFINQKSNNLSVYDSIPVLNLNKKKQLDTVNYLEIESSIKDSTYDFFLKTVQYFYPYVPFTVKYLRDLNIVINGHKYCVSVYDFNTNVKFRYFAGDGLLPSRAYYIEDYGIISVDLSSPIYKVEHSSISLEDLNTLREKLIEEDSIN